jgi:hypothetical protein
MMQNLKIFWVIVIAFSLTTGCNDKDDTVPDYIPGEDITAQLIEDLKADKSVTLPAGTFYLSEPVFINGYTGGIIEGAGKDLTIIKQPL